MTGSHAGPDRLAEHLARLGHLPGGVVHRALVAIAVAHRLDARGRCGTCARRRWPTVRLAARRQSVGQWRGRDRSGTPPPARPAVHPVPDMTNQW